MSTPRIVSNDWYAIRWSVLERDQFTCRYCGQVAPNVMLHVDHVLAVCEGGTDDLANLVTACSACNTGKEMYRAKAARVQQRNGHRGHGAVQGLPSLDPVILTALGDHPGGLTIRRIAELVCRDRSTLVKILNRMIDAQSVTYTVDAEASHNPRRTYHLASRPTG